MNITQQRLLNQKLVASDLRTPLEIVSWLGVVQSQDYAGAKWALALRAPQFWTTHDSHMKMITLCSL